MQAPAAVRSKGLSFGWDAETLPGNALTGRAEDRERRRSADDVVCTRDDRGDARVQLRPSAAGSACSNRFLPFEPH